MYQQPSSVNRNALSSNDCKSIFSLFQIALGVTLLISSAYGYSLLQHMAVFIPAIMGVALLYQGVKTVFICRVGPLFRDPQQHSGGMLG
ncbi:MAG: hypothetical protein ABW096_00055 [Candidatus Thiodiazotropha sp.]